MKFLRYNERAINLAHVIDICVSANYLVLTTIDGREEKFVYGAESKLLALMESVLAFSADDSAHVLDCAETLAGL